MEEWAVKVRLGAASLGATATGALNRYKDLKLDRTTDLSAIAAAYMGMVAS